MKEPTEVQATILQQAGWSYDPGLGFGYKCRICHTYTGDGVAAWVSPNAAFYHTWCVLESAQVKQLLRQAERRER